MSELPRRFVSRLRRYIGNRRKVKRAYVRLSFTLSLSDPRTTSNGSRRSASIEGHTLDISNTGLGLIVPAIRVGEHYLVGEERSLHLLLELPDGPVNMSVVPVRYESLAEDSPESGYIIGARLVEMDVSERERFDDYIGKLLTKQA
ncbi:MAG TPA: PilZ domain-containing protein [Pyrinomonadaceae bacterium]